MERVSKSKRVGLQKITEEFLGLVFTYDYEKARRKIPQYREREIEAEIRGFNKAQEALRDLIAVNGTDAILHLSELHVEGQRQPEMIGDRRVWFG